MARRKRSSRTEIDRSENLAIPKFGFYSGSKVGGVLWQGLRDEQTGLQSGLNIPKRDHMCIAKNIKANLSSQCHDTCSFRCIMSISAAKSAPHILCDFHQPLVIADFHRRPSTS